MGLCKQPVSAEPWSIGKIGTPELQGATISYKVASRRSSQQHLRGTGAHNG